MKKIKFLTMALFGGMLGWTSCSNESGNSGGTSSIPETVYQAFDAKYPNARQVSWKTKGAYAVATFYWDPANADAISNTSKSSAWFTLTGAEWGMSAYEIPFSLLPDTVQKAFLASPYAAWEYDREADVLCRPNADTLYVIEAEQQVGTTETSVDLYYTANAILVKEIIDADIDEDYSGMLPQKPASSVTDWIFERYPDARLIDVELEDGGTEVEFVANGNKMESFFTAASAWVYTKTDFSRKDFTKVPPIVLAALKRSEHYVSLEYVDDLSYYETAASGNYYCFELETRYDDVDVYITEAGEIVRQAGDSHVDALDFVGRAAPCDSVEAQSEQQKGDDNARPFDESRNRKALRPLEQARHAKEHEVHAFGRIKKQKDGNALAYPKIKFRAVEPGNQRVVENQPDNEKQAVRPIETAVKFPAQVSFYSQV